MLTTKFTQYWTLYGKMTLSSYVSGRGFTDWWLCISIFTPLYTCNITASLARYMLNNTCVVDSYHIAPSSSGRWNPWKRRWREFSRTHSRRSVGVEFEPPQLSKGLASSSRTVRNRGSRPFLSCRWWRQSTHQKQGNRGCRLLWKGLPVTSGMSSPPTHTTHDKRCTQVMYYTQITPKDAMQQVQHIFSPPYSSSAHFTHLPARQGLRREHTVRKASSLVPA